MEPRVLFNRYPVLVAGPLGCYRKHEEHEVQGHGRCIVVGIDHDAAGVLMPLDWLRANLDARNEEIRGRSDDEKFLVTWDQQLARYENTRTCPTVDFYGVSEWGRDGMRQQVFRNRREHRPDMVAA